jgi:hypothetical protein
MPSDDCEEPIAVIHSLRGSSDPDRDIGIHGGRINTDVVQSVELIMLREDFEDDYFTWGGCKFASEHLRNAMALDSSVVEFLEVDDSKSAPLPRSKKYQMMLPLLSADVSDRANSRYSNNPMLPESDFGPHDVSRIAIRADAAPTCDLFYDDFFGMTLLCTDALAVRVLEANCTGIVFEDPIGYRKGVRVRRTIHGIEEHDVD